MSKLFQCPLFKDLSQAETENLLDGSFLLKQFMPGELIAMQGSRYESLMIVAEGTVRGEMTDAMGRSTVIEEIAAPRAIAPAFLFATENRLPVSIIAEVKTEIAIIHRNHFTKMMQYDVRLLTNYLQSMADRSRFLSDKLRMQRFGTMKSKLAKYLLEMAQSQNLNEFTIPHTQQELADIFGVTRPALARCIGLMAVDGLFISRKNQFKILDKKRLMEELL